ncbi:DUF3859 domain-containing protein [Jannaschia sp. LMIT008]|uniref:DUF3859 domain-containing protein n=1 Tax=Jannaschia maritima TaxID=3032585 RepID=UPI0028125A4A|nr:DUF3859 domain-containing protein [Jannaschia sp. LMIT008]
MLRYFLSGPVICLAGCVSPMDALDPSLRLSNPGLTGTIDGGVACPATRRAAKQTGESLSRFDYRASVVPAELGTAFGVRIDHTVGSVSSRRTVNVSIDGPSGREVLSTSIGASAGAGSSNTLITQTLGTDNRPHRGRWTLTVQDGEEVLLSASFDVVAPDVAARAGIDCADRL